MEKGKRKSMCGWCPACQWSVLGHRTSPSLRRPRPCDVLSFYGDTSNSFSALECRRHANTWRWFCLSCVSQADGPTRQSGTAWILFCPLSLIRVWKPFSFKILARKDWYVLWLGTQLIYSCSFFHSYLISERSQCRSVWHLIIEFKWHTVGVFFVCIFLV